MQILLRKRRSRSKDDRVARSEKETREEKKERQAWAAAAPFFLGQFFSIHALNAASAPATPPSTAESATFLSPWTITMRAPRSRASPLEGPPPPPSFPSEANLGPLATPSSNAKVRLLLFVLRLAPLFSSTLKKEKRRTEQQTHPQRQHRVRVRVRDGLLDDLPRRRRGRASSFPSLLAAVAPLPRRVVGERVQKHRLRHGVGHAGRGALLGGERSPREDVGEVGGVAALVEESGEGGAAFVFFIRGWGKGG